MPKGLPHWKPQRHPSVFCPKVSNKQNFTKILFGLLLEKSNMLTILLLNGKSVGSNEKAPINSLQIVFRRHSGPENREPVALE